MTSYQNAVDHATDQLRRGLINADQANVLIVQIMGVRIVRGKLTVQVRKALNAAVKAGELGHIKAEGLRPEVYHHKNARARALEVRDEAFREATQTLKSVFA